MSYALALLIPLLATSQLTPWAASLARRLGVLDEPAEHRFHLQSTPYLGGVAVAAGLVLMSGWALLGISTISGADDKLVTIILWAVVLAVLGLIDDVRTVRPLIKVAVEAAAGVALWRAGIRASLFGITGLDITVTVLWVIAITNAVNLLDNMDGLASGVTAIGAFTYFVIAAQRGDYLVASFALGLTGASIGFLRHNFPPARIFLGDAGSLFLGFLLAALALQLDLIGEAGVIRAAVPALILGVPIVDTALVMVSRLTEGRRVYVGGTDHASHRLVGKGLSSQGVALVTFGAQLACCALAFALIHSSGNLALALVLLSGAAVCGLLLYLLSLPSLGRPRASALAGVGTQGHLEIRRETSI